MSRDLELAICNAVDDAFESEHVPWFKRLVETPSHTAAPGNVEKAVSLIDELALQLGMQLRRYADPDGQFADHRIYSTPSTTETDQAIALVGHCDTVYPELTGFLEFKRDEPDSDSGGDIVRGPGVLDMKSGLTEVMFALQAIQRAAPNRWQTLKLRFLCNTDEEVGSPSSRAMFDEISPLTSYAMVFEGGRDEDRIITARKGTGGFRLSASGHEAHAGNDHASGVNAIHALALVIPDIEALTDYDQGTTINVGVVEGGTAKNTVPGSASALIDVRVSTIAQAKHIEEELTRIASEALRNRDDVPEKLRTARFELEGKILRFPMEATERCQKLRVAYEPFAEAQGLGIGEAPSQGGGSDANLLAARGVPTIDGLGPFGKDFHSVREWSSLLSLQRRTRALACFLVSDAANRLSSEL